MKRNAEEQLHGGRGRFNESKERYPRSAENNTSGHRQRGTTFRVPHPKDQQRHQATRVTISQPQEIAHFSKYADDQVQFNRSNLVRYRTPTLDVDLLEGIESYIPNDESDPLVPPAPLGPLLATMRHFHARISKPPQFVTYRNNLNKILGTPYNTSNSWTLCAEKKDGCVYLDVRRTADELERNSRPAPVNQANAMYSGRRFELYATETKSSSEDASNRQVNQDEEYCGLFTLTLGEKRLVVAAEIDCYDAHDKDTGKYSYVELKTTRTLHTDKDRYVFERFKLLSFWIQSYIVGTPRIICGFRDDDFQLKKLQTFKTTEIPSFCRKYWDPQVCLGFADTLLQWILDTIVEGSVYSVSYHPRDHHVEIIEMQGEGVVSFLATELSKDAAAVGSEAKPSTTKKG